MVHDCLFIYIAAVRHIWRSFPYPPHRDAAGSLQKGPNRKKNKMEETSLEKSCENEGCGSGRLCYDAK